MRLGVDDTGFSAVRKMIEVKTQISSENIGDNLCHSREKIFALVGINLVSVLCSMSVSGGLEG